MKIFAFTFLLINIFALSSEMATLNVHVTGLESDEGKLRVGLYKDKAGWLKEPYKGMALEIKNGEVVFDMTDIPPGTYAVSCFHDQNDNGELDLGWFGIPKEPYASSNDADGTFSAPKWEDAKFIVTEENQKIKINF